MLLKFQLFADNEPRIHAIEDSKAYLFLPTASGLVSIANNMDLKAFARRLFSVDAEVKIEKIGGILNDVYLVKTVVGGEEKRAVAKSFRDWAGFKWFPLSLWTMGTKTFTLLGKSRLERECAINRLLYSNGFPVPRLLGVNAQERLVFMEYVEGESLEKIVKLIMNPESSEDEVKRCVAIIFKVGETMAKIHSLNITLGDTKPENMLLAKDGKIYFLDLEQASRRGDKSWDIAEFLYYSGHYASPFYGIKRARLLAEAFIKGYLSTGGDLNTVKAAGKPKYARVFSLFTIPTVIIAISKICQNAYKLVGEDG
ncbi:hypothetical protein H5T51_03540 [Candidatus Bathyarchaeota archaeon]|nr:hypothetical protein [Candidatus Bathyarchaeota archaeon]